MDLLKNNSFSAEEAINYIPRTKKRKKVPVCEIIAYRDSSTIHPSSKLELVCQYKMTLYCDKELYHR